MSIHRKKAMHYYYPEIIPSVGLIPLKFKSVNLYQE